MFEAPIVGGPLDGQVLRRSGHQWPIFLTPAGERMEPKSAHPRRDKYCRESSYRNAEPPVYRWWPADVESGGLTS